MFFVPTRAHHGEHCAVRSLRQQQSGAAGRTVAGAAFASSVTRTGARADGRSCLDSDKRCHARKSRVRSCGAERDGGHNRHLDEHRHGDAHLLVRCAGLGLGRNRSGRSVLVRVSSGRDVPLSLRDSSGDGRKGCRPLTFMSIARIHQPAFRRTQSCASSLPSSSFSLLPRRRASRAPATRARRRSTARSAEDLAFHQLEDQVIDVARSLQLVDCANIGMIERCQHAASVCGSASADRGCRKRWRDVPAPIAACRAACIRRQRGSPVFR